MLGDRATRGTKLCRREKVALNVEIAVEKHPKPHLVSLPSWYAVHVRAWRKSINSQLYPPYSALLCEGVTSKIPASITFP